MVVCVLQFPHIYLTDPSSVANTNFQLSNPLPLPWCFASSTCSAKTSCRRSWGGLRRRWFEGQWPRDVYSSNQSDTCTVPQAPPNTAVWSWYFYFYFYYPLISHVTPTVTLKSHCRGLRNTGGLTQCGKQSLLTNIFFFYFYNNELNCYSLGLWGIFFLLLSLFPYAMYPQMIILYTAYTVLVCQRGRMFHSNHLTYRV